MEELCGGVIAAAPELMRSEFAREGVKLHATLINSKFLSGGSEELEVHWGRRRRKAGVKVDATILFKV